MMLEARTFVKSAATGVALAYKSVITAGASTVPVEPTPEAVGAEVPEPAAALASQAVPAVFF